MWGTWKVIFAESISFFLWYQCKVFVSTCVNSLKNKKKKNPGPSDSVIPLLRTFPKEMIRNTVLHSSKHPEVGNWNVLNSFFPAEPVCNYVTWANHWPHWASAALLYNRSKYSQGGLAWGLREVMLPGSSVPWSTLSCGPIKEKAWGYVVSNSKYNNNNNNKTPTGDHSFV